MAAVGNKEPTNNRSSLEGIAQFLDYNSNPDNPPIMTGGATKPMTEMMEFIMKAILGSRKKNVPSPVPLPKKSEIKTSRQPGGIIVTDNVEDATEYAKRGSGQEPDPEFGSFYNITTKPEGLINVENLPKSAIETLRMIRGPVTKGSDDVYGANMRTVDQMTADDILRFLENPAAYNFPSVYSKKMANALSREGIGGLLFDIKNASGLLPPPNRAIISTKNPIYLRQIQNPTLKEKVKEQMLKPEFTREEMLKRLDESRKRLNIENTPRDKDPKK